MVTVLSGGRGRGVGESFAAVGGVFQRVDAVADGPRLQDPELAVEREAQQPAGGFTQLCKGQR